MKSNKPLLGVLALAVIGQGALHSGYLQNFWSKNYSPGNSQIQKELSPDQIILQLFGFREFLAGILWVRADGFFDQGNYDAVLPIIRLCTILDPKQIDVYATGMWHIGYNFTDEEQRSDRRYIESAIALGKEGSRQNPNTYEMFFETGWMWYHKIDDDYFQAVKWFEEAAKRDDILPARRNLLTQAYMRNGQVEDALNLYYGLYDKAKLSVESPDVQFGSIQQFSTIENNLDTTLVRMVQRGWVAKYSPDGKQNGWFNSGAYDTKPPFDVGFSAKVTVLSDRVIRVEGTWNVLPVGTRVRVTLRDAEYPNAKLAELDWDGTDGVKLDPPRDKTFMQDQLFVRNRKFNRKVDMSKDPTMYPFLGKKYIIEFYYNPRSAPPHIQDKFGYSGEGFTDANFLRTDVRQSQKLVPGKKDEDGSIIDWVSQPLNGLQQPVMYTSLEISQDQIRRKGEWVDKIPVISTKNYKEAVQGREKDDVIMVPTLRAGATGGGQ